MHASKQSCSHNPSILNSTLWDVMVRLSMTPALCKLLPKGGRRPCCTTLHMQCANFCMQGNSAVLAVLTHPAQFRRTHSQLSISMLSCRKTGNVMMAASQRVGKSGATWALTAQTVGLGQCKSLMLRPPRPCQGPFSCCVAGR